ncbi:hypothetical protein [Luteolibacter marinus]|uniref:hypothetical protein n=1 Tax=Luteolibacter marinus TaxID=2776705 RepID=UPI001865DAB0|nr:hypothetical protein [Luteolibacter marinus]
MSDPVPSRPAPVCPVHDKAKDSPMVFINTWDGRDWYECPHPECSCAIDYPTAHDPARDPHRSPARQHPGEDAEYHDPEI